MTAPPAPFRRNRRMRQVALLLVFGLDRTEIARRLGLHLNTVDWHMRQLRKITRSQSASQLAGRLAILLMCEHYRRSVRRGQTRTFRA